MNDTEIINSLMRIDGRSQSINMIAANQIRDLNIEIERLRAERDEARQEVCSLKSLDRCCVISPKGYAELRKWDCFSKEDGK